MLFRRSVTEIWFVGWTMLQTYVLAPLSLLQPFLTKGFEAHLSDETRTRDQSRPSATEPLLPGTDVYVLGPSHGTTSGDHPYRICSKECLLYLKSGVKRGHIGAPVGGGLLHHTFKQSQTSIWQTQMCTVILTP
jgi:hypothetical protein